MDLARWPGGIFDLPTQRNLELSLRLAIPATDARHSRRASRCRASGGPVLPAADVVSQSTDRAHLDYRAARPTFFAAIETVSRAGDHLSGLLHGVVCVAWKELLPRTDLSNAACRRRGRDRVIFEWGGRPRSPSPAALAQACDRADPARQWRSPCAHRRTNSFSGQISCLYKDSAFQASSDGALPRPRGVAAMVRRPIWMERNC